MSVRRFLTLETWLGEDEVEVSRRQQFVALAAALLIALAGIVAVATHEGPCARLQSRYAAVVAQSGGDAPQSWDEVTAGQERVTERGRVLREMSARAC